VYWIESVSSISGSESDTNDDDDEADSHATSKPIGITARFQNMINQVKKQEGLGYGV
jgi:hypothetical protein